MCTRGDQMPGDVAEALQMAGAAMDYLNGPESTVLEAAGLGDVLLSLGRISGKFAAARAGIMARFDAAEAHDDDGYGSCATWLTAMGRMTRQAANAQVKQMRQLRDHPEIHQGLASKAISESWAAEMAKMTSKLPSEVRGDIDKLLVGTAVAGADLHDLALVARTAYEAWRRSQGPDPDDGSGDDPDDGGFDERYLRLGTTLDGVGTVTGNLTKECAEALQAVLDALGKKAGPEDDRTEGQRFHDALQLACELLIRAKMTPDRAGADTRVEAIVALSQLRSLPGATAFEEAWLAAKAGEHGYLTGKDAEVIACDALIVPVVTGHPDLSVVDQMIDLVLGYLGLDETCLSHGTQEHATEHPATEDPGRLRSRPLSPQAWQALRYAMAKLAIDLVSGPGGIASVLRQGLLDAPYIGKSVALDIGFSDSIPPAIRKAVQLRAKGVCEWPGCCRRAAWCDVHHLVHKADGGKTSVSGCVLLCQFHHDVCIHRKGWRLVLHPDATTTAYGPNGQVLHSHGPPRDQGPPADERPPGRWRATQSGPTHAKH